MSVPKVIQDIRDLKSENTSIKSTYLSENKTLYVSTTGNDTTGDGSQASPYKTINKAVSMIPKNLNGYNASINIAAGTYDETVSLDGFTRRVTLTGVADAAVNIRSLSVSNCTCLINNILITFNNVSNNGIYVANNGWLHSYKNIRVTAGNIGIAATLGGKCTIDGSLTTSGVSYVVRAYSGSMVHVNVITGSNYTYGLNSIQGSIITYNTLSLSSPTPNAINILTGSGGRVYSGAQSTTSNTLATATLYE